MHQQKDLKHSVHSVCFHMGNLSSSPNFGIIAVSKVTAFETEVG